MPRRAEKKQSPTKTILAKATAKEMKATAGAKNAAVPNRTADDVGKGAVAGSRIKTLLLILIPLALVFLVFFAVVLPSLSNVSFSTFKSNFDSAKSVALVVTYHNTSQYISESQCFSTAIQVIAARRNASTIGFYLLNQTNCTYSPTGLGHAINISTTTKAYCLSLARSVPTVYLNYSQTNSTQVKAYGLYVYGNSAYWAGCPIAAELS